MSQQTNLSRKPRAEIEKVEDLVEFVRRGQVRVPWFQRGLKWTKTEVQELFDSIYRGYPIGSLLFYRRAAPAERLQLGPLEIDASELSEAWWVVDGQQRVTTLTVCLTRPLPLPPRAKKEDPFVLYFDSAEQTFRTPETHQEIPSLWVPLPALLDGSRLTEWVFGWQHGQERALRNAVFEAGARVREYTIPLYLIETEDEQIAQQIYYRTNQSGTQLEWTEVHKALFGGDGASPSTLEELADEVSDVGMGRLDEDRLLTCLMALRGQDPTRSLAEHYRRDREFLSGAVQEALPVLRRVLSFLRRNAGVPHLRLLPQSILLDILTRFFALHPDPNPRTRILLSRWFWRTVLGAGIFDDRTLRRRGVRAVETGEEESVQNLLSLVRKERPRDFELPPAFDARAAASRITMLALAHLEPREFLQGRPLDVVQLLTKDDKNVFCKILETGDLEFSASPVNRTIHSSEIPIHKLLQKRISEQGPADPVLASHAINPDAARCLLSNDLAGFLRFRAETLTREVRNFAERMAEWDQSDRPSIDYLLAEAGVEA